MKLTRGEIRAVAILGSLFVGSSVVDWLSGGAFPLHALLLLPGLLVQALITGDVHSMSTLTTLLAFGLEATILVLILRATRTRADTTPLD